MSVSQNFELRYLVTNLKSICPCLFATSFSSSFGNLKLCPVKAPLPNMLVPIATSVCVPIFGNSEIKGTPHAMKPM